MKRILPCFAALLFAAARPAASAQTPAPSAAAPAAQDASAPIPKKDKDGAFLRRHESFLARAKAGPIGLLFLGDSITDNWAKAPGIWTEYYGQYQPANFGIGGDRTQHVIWRIENGELDGIHPRVVVFMLGTNNTDVNTAAEIAAADEKIVRLIQAKIPGVKVLLLAIFPRGLHLKGPDAAADEAKRMKVIRAANLELARLDDGKSVRYLDLGADFLEPDGTISPAIMADQLHPTVAGYKIWAQAMQPLLGQMMQ